MTRSRLRAIATTLSALVLGLAACGGEPADPAVTATPQPTRGAEPTQDAEPTPDEASPSPSAPDPESPSPRVTGTGERPRVVGTVASGLETPWGVAFLPDGTAVVTERDTTRVLTIDRDRQVREVGRMTQAAPVGEAGLLGVAVSPTYDRDRLVYFYLTTAEDNRVVRATLRGGRLGEPRVVLDGIPNGFVHDGGRLEFGPDGLLYVSTGEIGQEQLAQDRASLAGKVLRITPDGDPAPGNPDPASPVWSWGHRNVQGLAFDDADRLWASEFGANSFDELNLIDPGVNYGWPEVEGVGDDERFRNPEVVWRTDEASPSGLAFREGYLWLAALRGNRLWRVDVSGGRARAPRDFLVGEYGRLRSVVVAPDGMLWVTTSNRDGRGDPAADDDRILLVDPS
jgi:glucose/arabinose dehydrogenase